MKSVIIEAWTTIGISRRILRFYYDTPHYPLVVEFFSNGIQEYDFVKAGIRKSRYNLLFVYEYRPTNFKNRPYNLQQVMSSE